MDTLVALHRKLQKAVDLCRVRPLARKVFRRLYDHRYEKTRLARATQNGREWWLHPEVALRGEFQEFETITWLRGVIRPGMTVIDIGANVGQMTLEMAHLVGPSGKVIAIEPASGNVELLREHVRANGYCDRVEIVTAACGDKDSVESDFVIYGVEPHSVGSGHRLSTPTRDGYLEAAAHVVKVPVLTCDALCSRLNLKPHVLKIDVEGAETLVLQGAWNVLSECQPSVRMGFHPFAFNDPQATGEGIFYFFKQLGYTLQSDHPSKWDLSEYVFMPKATRTLDS